MRTVSQNYFSKNYLPLILFFVVILQILPAKSIPLISAATQTGTIYFGENLKLKKPMTFNGTETQQTIEFPYPRSWAKQPGSVLYLRLAHSPGLIPRLSHIETWLNNSQLKTITLDSSNIGPTDIALPLVESDLKEYNHLTIKVVQHCAEECEDPFHSSLWTEIGLASRIEFKYNLCPCDLNLLNWPYPFVDISNPDKQTIGLILPDPDKVSQEDAQAIAALGQNLGSIGTFNPIAFVNGLSSSGPKIAIGCPNENRQIADVGALLPIPIKDGRFIDAAGMPLENTIGVLELVENPKDTGSPLLIVSGNSPQAVINASHALISGNINPILGGQAALIKIQPPSLAPVSVLPGKNNLIPETEFELSELGFKTHTVHGTDPEAISIDISSYPELIPVGHNQKMRLIFGYAAQLNTDLSSLEVKLNDVTLRSYPLIRTEGEEHHEDEVEIPNALFTNHNQLKFIFHLFPKNIGKCLPKIDTQLWATLYDTTRLEINYELISKLPNLNYLQSQGFPLARDSYLRDIAIVIPAGANSSTLLGLAKLSYLFGQWSQQTESVIAVACDNAIPEQYKTQKHLIILNNTQENKLIPALGTALPLIFQKSGECVFKDANSQEISIKENSPNGYLEEIISPWNKNKVILVISGNTDSAFALALEGLLDPSLCYQLHGNVAFVSPHKTVKGLQVTTPISISSASPWRLFNIWLSGSIWLAPLLILFLLVPLIYFLLRVARGKKQGEGAKQKLKEQDISS